MYKFLNCFFLGVISILLIYIILQKDNFIEDLESKNNDIIKANINNKSKGKINEEDEINYIDKISNEKYYDYNYNYIVNNPKKKIVKVPYPVKVKVNDNRDLAKVLSNTVGTPINQVYTPYSVIDKNSKKYKDWDRFFFPGYSYFPPSKWHIPVDNKYKFPPGYYKESNVCPISVNNVWSEYLSGDVVAKQIENIKNKKTQ